MHSTRVNNKIIISIDGNIGSGKSTFFNQLKDKLNDRKDILFLEEPVDSWDKVRDENDKTILEKYCNDQEKYGFSFQIMACVTRMKLLMDALKVPNVNFIISERSIITDKNVFAKMLFDDKKIENINYEIYKLFYNAHRDMIQNIVIVYIQTDPKICKERIQKRNRKGEDSIPMEYLEMCHKYHESWIMNKNVNHKMIINGNSDNYKNPEMKETWINKFIQFLNYYHTNYINDSNNFTFTNKKKNNVICV